MQNILKSLLFIRAVRESPSVGLHGLKSIFGVIPWFDHISIFNWIPRSSRGMTEVESLHKTSSTKNHSVESQIFQNEAKALPVYTVPLYKIK
ncbi:hypothetical protein [Rickettsia montanensis]|uniref:hypothetical protein n=1 Tax=Rickettsia montanensis TaxID=33991 RepID=UPI001E28F5CB|nr:hypothetical protein [Rickettsia montanensis]